MDCYVIKHHKAASLMQSFQNERRGTLDVSLWVDKEWQDVEVIDIGSFRQESSEHRPLTQAKLQYDQHGIYGLFKVQDQYVRCVHQNFQDLVCKDSCVEIYFHPKPEGQVDDHGYVNLEMSGNGTLLSYYITDAERAPGGFKKFVKLTAEQGRKVKISTSLASTVEPEITESKEWLLAFYMPFSLLQEYVGDLGDLSGRNVDFQSELIDQFIQAIGIYPAGTIIELSDGRIGIVTGQNKTRRLRPDILLVMDQDKNFMDHFPIIKLMSEKSTIDGQQLSIKQALPPGSYDISPSDFFL